VADDQDQQHDHWRELAELLGVPESPHAPEKPKAAAGVTVRPEPVVAKRPDSVAENAPAKEPQPAMAVAEARVGVEPVRLPSLSVSEQEDLAREREAAPPPGERGWEPPARGEERPRQGKQRRGGGGRSERQSESARGRADDRRAEPAGEHPRPALDEDDDQRHDLESLDERVDDNPVEEGETTPAPADDDIDEEDNLSDWTVPSWTELIASLYRPER